MLIALTGLAATLLAVVAPSAAYADRVPYSCDRNPVENGDSFVHTSSREPGSGGKDSLSVFTVN